MPPSAAQPVQSNCPHPSLLVRHPGELAALAERSDEGLLHRILGVGQVAADRVELHDEAAVGTVALSVDIITAQEIVRLAVALSAQAAVLSVW